MFLLRVHKCGFQNVYPFENTFQNYEHIHNFNGSIIDPVNDQIQDPINDHIKDPINDAINDVIMDAINDFSSFCILL